MLGASEIPFADAYPKPKALTADGLKRIEQAFVDAVERCKQIGCKFTSKFLTEKHNRLICMKVDFIQLHFAHGYLVHTFLSPLSNNRTDSYGGPALANRTRFPLRLAKACRDVWAGPLIVRISASDWADELGPEGSEEDGWNWWGVKQSTIFAGELEKLGVDVVDVSSGGLWAKQKIELKPGYQVCVFSTYPTSRRAHSV